jgi:hypothetical protein
VNGPQLGRRKRTLAGDVVAGFAFGVQAGGEVADAEFVVGLSGGHPDHPASAQLRPKREDLAAWENALS